MGFWLMPQPEAWLTGTVNVPKYSDFSALVDHCNYLEDAMIATGQAIYSSGLGGPQAAAENQALLANGWPSVSELDTYAQKRGVPAWRVKLQFYGPPEVIQARWEYAQQRISNAIPGTTFTNFETLPMPLSPEQELTHHLVNFGIPNMAIFASMARQPGETDPKDGHTDFFAVCPRSGEAVFKALKLAYDTQKELGVTPITATPFRGPVTWHHKVFFMGAPAVDSQRDNPEFNRRSRALYDAYVKRFSDAGFPPYRTNPGAQDLLAAQFSFGNGSLLRFQEALKDGIDPNGILAPGRYGVWPKRLRPSRA